MYTFEQVEMLFKLFVASSLIELFGIYLFDYWITRKEKK